MVGRGAMTWISVQFVALFSEMYPAAGETHGLSVVAGAVHAAFADRLDALEVLDLVAHGREDTEEIARAVAAIEPHILAISVPYGTYSLLTKLAPVIASVADGGGLVLLGGALPTYLAEELLRDVDSRAVVIVGEGETAIVDVIERWAERGNEFRSDDCPPAHTVLMVNGGVVRGRRELVPVHEVPLPYRAHAGDIAAAGAQLFLNPRARARGRPARSACED
jgi:radical SAM superfamily enzyme YgiQ (UPF0313 family)